MSTGQMLPGEEVRYIWIDEDQAQISPVHKNFGAALNFCAEWREKFDRLQARAEAIREEMEDERQAKMEGPQGNAVLAPHRAAHYERETDKIRRSRDAITITGKPPAKLKRLVIRTTREEPTDIELQLAAQELEKIDR